MHALALGFIAINVVLLMMPAALHRLSYGGEDSEQFLRIGSALVIAAPFFLAGGIATEIYVVLQKVIEDIGWSAVGACAAFLVIVLCWYALPILLRASGKMRGTRQKAQASTIHDDPKEMKGVRLHGFDHGPTLETRSMGCKSSHQAYKRRNGTSRTSRDLGR
jgi:hypothetical protein